MELLKLQPSQAAPTPLQQVQSTADTQIEEACFQSLQSAFLPITQVLTIQSVNLNYLEKDCLQYKMDQVPF